MAAFTSAGTGNWNVNGTWTTAGYPGDGVSGVTDTWTIANGHTVTMPWGVVALPAVVGAGTINLGGILDWQAGFTSAFCNGNITVTGTLSSPAADANAKVLWMSGDKVITVSNANTAYLNLQKNMKIYFALATKGAGGIYINALGKFTMEGTSSASKDCMIQGAVGKEPYVYINGNSSSTVTSRGGLNNCTFDFCGRYNATYIGALNMTVVNVYRENQFPIGNIDITNVPIVATSGVNDRGLYSVSVNFPSGTGTITATAAANFPFYFENCYIDGGTFNGTTTSGSGAYIYNVTMNGGSMTLVSTSGYGASITSTIINAGTISATSSSNFGISAVGITMNGGTVTGTSGSSTGVNIYFWLHYGGTLTGVSTSSLSLGCYNGCALHGGLWDIYGSAPTAAQSGFYSAYFGFKHFGGTLSIRNNYNGFGMANSQDLTYQKTGTKGFNIYDNTAALYSETTWRGNEPLIYKNSSSLKTATIYFPCTPWNQGDFSFAGAGAVDYGDTTAGAITITGAGVLTFPQVQPWDVAGWTAITYAVSGGNSPVYEYRYSTDNGSSWSTWTAYTTPKDLTGIAAGLNGNDIIQLRATNGAGASALTLTNFTITFSYSRETSPEYSEESEGPLFFPTYAKAAAYLTIWATMPDDASSVIATLYTDAGGTETLTSATATQKAGTAQWYWSTTNITTQPTTLTHYRVQFKDQNNNKTFRDLYLGGTEDDIITTKINAGLIPALL